MNGRGLQGQAHCAHVLSPNQQLLSLDYSDRKPKLRKTERQRNAQPQQQLSDKSPTWRALFSDFPSPFLRCYALGMCRRLAGCYYCLHLPDKTLQPVKSGDLPWGWNTVMIQWGDLRFPISVQGSSFTVTPCWGQRLKSTESALPQHNRKGVRADLATDGALL